MKARIIGYLLVIAVVAALYVVTEQPGNNNTQSAPAFKPSNNDAAFKGLSVN